MSSGDAARRTLYSRGAPRLQHYRVSTVCGSRTSELLSILKKYVTEMWFASVLLLLSTAISVRAYPTGAPESACVDMVPGHGVGAQPEPFPYTITTSTTEVKAGTPMQVTIKGNTPSDTIKGILLQARLGDTPVGDFTVDPENPYAQLLDCGTPSNAVTHKRHEGIPDPDVLTFTWTPPADLNGVIKFRATIVYSLKIFWVGIESEPIKVYT